MNIIVRTFIAAAMLLSSVYGAYNDSLYIFSRSSQDCYADGTPVVDGEFYAVIFQKDGTEFEGFTANGTLNNTNCSTFVAAAPLAKNGRCRPFVLQVESSFVSSLGKGELQLYLLDTRTKLVNGKYELAATASNVVSFVRSYSKCGTSSTESMSRSVNSDALMFAAVKDVPKIDMTFQEIQTNYVDVVTTNFVEKIVDICKTNTIYRIAETAVTNYVDVLDTSDQTIPVVDSKKAIVYQGIVRDSNGNEIGEAKVRMAVPNTYGIVHASFTLKIRKANAKGKISYQTITKAAYGMMNDFGGASMNFQKKTGKAVFKLNVGAGYLFVKDSKTKAEVEYLIECEAMK